MLLLVMFKRKGENIHKDLSSLFISCYSLSTWNNKKISEALEDESWVDAMQEELLQFEIQKVWILVDLPYGKEEWLEAIRIFLAFASYMGFIVYQMDCKSDFSMASKIVFERYMCLTPGFLDPKYTEKVYKVVKALYGLHQAPRACVYDGANIVGNPTTGGFVNFLEERDYYWQCKKQTIVATSTTEAEYVAAASLNVGKFYGFKIK
ncbi:putative ribonuclease H-like domain-containing protein [Tanacetum coccineum]